MVSAVRSFFEGCPVSRVVNHTLLALIPKRTTSNKVDQFRSISLCNVVYKVITKILASRIRPLLDQIIHSSQSAFIPHQSILDNIIINHEIMCHFKARKERKGYIAVKVDMAKAYDMVEWDVLLKILELHGFDKQFYQLIHKFLASTHFSTLVNGSPYGFFTSYGGIRQGDPLSSALFAILSDLLSRICDRAED